MLSRSLALCLLIISLSANVVSAQVTSLNPRPNGLSPGDQFRYVFVTDGLETATNSNLAFYDDFVTAQANQDGSLFSDLGLTFQVIGSTSTVNAIDHISPGGDVPFVAVNGDVVTTDISGFFGGPFDTNFRLTQSGQEVNFNTLIFSGTGSDGVAANGTEIGSPNIVTALFVDSDGLDNFFGAPRSSPNSPRRFVGISSVVTAVPEPSSFIVIGLAGLSLAGRRRRCSTAIA